MALYSKLQCIYVPVYSQADRYILTCIAYYIMIPFVRGWHNKPTKDNTHCHLNSLLEHINA